MGLLDGKTGIVFGVANKRSIAWAIAQALASAGMRLAFTYEGERIKENVEELAATLPGSLVYKCDVGSEKVATGYHVMGVAKAALEASVRYLAADLGPRGVRVNAISAGPVNTLAARGIRGFTDMLKHHAEHAPLRRNVELREIGDTALFLASRMASGITGEVIYVDCGYRIMAV